MVEKAKKASLSTLNDIMDEVFPMIKTNFSKTELIQLGMGILSYQLGDTQGFPKSNIMGEDVKDAIGIDCVVPTTLEANVKQLHAFLFDQEDYSPSETVLKRSDYIAAHTGFGNDYVSDELKQNISDRESAKSDSFLFFLFTIGIIITVAVVTIITFFRIITAGLITITVILVITIIIAIIIAISTIVVTVIFIIIIAVIIIIMI